MVGVQPVQGEPTHTLTVRSDLCQGGHGLVPDLSEGICLGPGHQDKGALGGSRMRQRELGVGRGHTLVGNDVRVQGARTLGLGAHAAGISLQALAHGQELARSKGRRHQDHRVEVVGLLGSPLRDDGGRAGQRGHVSDCHARRRAQCAHGLAQRRDNTSHVAAQGDDGLDRLLRGLRQQVAWSRRCGSRLRGWRRGRPSLVSRRRLRGRGRLLPSLILRNLILRGLGQWRRQVLGRGLLLYRYRGVLIQQSHSLSHAGGTSQPDGGGHRSGSQRVSRSGRLRRDPCDERVLSLDGERRLGKLLRQGRGVLHRQGLRGNGLLHA